MGFIPSLQDSLLLHSDDRKMPCHHLKIMLIDNDLFSLGTAVYLFTYKRSKHLLVWTDSAKLALPWQNSDTRPARIFPEWSKFRWLLSEIVD